MTKRNDLLKEMGLMDSDEAKIQEALEKITQEIDELQEQLKEKRRELESLTHTVAIETINEAKSTTTQRSEKVNTIFKDFNTTRTRSYIKQLRERVARGNKRYGYYEGEEQGILIMRQNLDKTYDEIADLLNAAGLTTRQGLEWDAKRLERVMKSTFVDEAL